jgi:adenylate cyclase
MSTPPGSKHRIMIVDDSFIMRKLVREIVETDDDLVVVDVAEDGRIALQKVREAKPDLILMDIEMPEMSGLEALRRLGLRSTSKVVILSARVGEGMPEAAEAMRLGAAAVLAKPSGSVSLDVKQREGERILRTVREILGLPPRPEPAPEPAPGAAPGPLVQDVLLGAMTAGVLVFDAGLTLTLSNPAGCRLLGRQSIAPGTTLDALFDDYNEGLGADLRAVQQTGERLAAAETDYALPDGQWQSLRLSALPVPGQPGPGLMVLLEDNSREREVRRLLSNTLSANVAEKLLEDGKLSLGGRLARASILFSDIRGFTRLSQDLGAEGIVALLNEYFSYMEDVLKADGGFIDKYIGDAIMALFGVPVSQGNDADAAVRGGIKMVEALEVLNTDRVARGQPAIKIGIGIATGDVIAGNIGSPSRMNYTVIGDAVNLASRIESLTKLYGAELMVCETTMRALATPVPSRKLDVVRVSGQTTATAIHEVLRGDRLAQGAANQAYEAGLAAYIAGRFAEAAGPFGQAVALNPADKAAALLSQRCAQLLAAPPAAWDGVWTHLEK